MTSDAPSLSASRPSAAVAVTVRYFASIREAVGQGAESWQTQASTVGALRDELLAAVMETTLSKLTPTDMFTDSANARIAEVERKELGRIEKSDWYERFAYIQDDESYFDLRDRREVSRQTFNALFRHISCTSIHTNRKVEASVCFDENRQAMGAKVLQGVTYAPGESVLVARAEATSEDGLERLKAALVAQLEKSGLDAPDFSGENAGH